MAIEIERKFLVRDIRFLQDAQGENIVQGYVAKEQGAMSTRVRIRADRAFLTIKGPRAGITRDEFEYPIPIADAVRMLSAYCNDRIVRKTRYLVHFHTQTFEVDVFEGKHAGLVVAEIELPHEGAPIVLPTGSTGRSPPTRDSAISGLHRLNRFRRTSISTGGQAPATVQAAQPT